MIPFLKPSRTPTAYSPDPQFYAETLDLFLKRRVGNLYNWLYSSPNAADDIVRGGELLDALYLNCSDYYLYDKESSLIAANAPDLARAIGPHATLIDYGPGPVRSYTQKTLPVLQQLVAPKGYVPVDICPEYVAGCEQETHSRLPGMNTNGIVGDFYDSSISHKSYNKPVVYFSGSSIANCPEPDAYTLPVNTFKRLETIRSQLNENGYLVIGHDTNQDEANLLAAYDNSYLSDLILNVLHRIARDLPVTNFNPEHFALWVKWDASDRCVKMGVRATKAQTFTLGRTEITIEADDIFHIASSYKYPSSLFIGMTEAAGFAHVQSFSEPNNPMAIHIFKAD